MLRTISLLLLLGVMAWGQTELLVLHKGGGFLGFYTDKGQRIVSVPTNPHPHEMVLSPDGRHVYTSDNGTMAIEHPGAGGNTVSIVDVVTRKKVGEISLGQYHRPHGIDVDRRTGTIYVSCEYPDQLLALDPLQKRVLRTYDTKGKTAHMVTLGPKGEWAYVSNSSSQTVAAVNVKSGKVKLIPVGDRPEGSALSTDGKHLYVTNRESAEITIIDTTKQATVGSIKTSRGPVRMKVTPDGMLVYALLHDNAVGIADAATRKEVAVVPLEGMPVSLDLSHDGKYAYASAQDDDTVHVVSVTGRQVIRKIKTPSKMFPDPVMEVNR